MASARTMRVGFVYLPSGSSWLGGSNYQRNLFLALTREDCGVEPVLVTTPRGSSALPDGFPALPVLETNLLARKTAPWAARHLVRKLTRTDFLLAQALRSSKIPVLSHSGPLGRHSPVPAISWIPDFQHVHLPQYFSPEMRRQRDLTNEHDVRTSSLVIVSSEAARGDLLGLYPDAEKKVRVLRFADCSAHEANATGIEELRARYLLPERYLLLPNQFWAHKNHATVVEALAVLRRTGREVVVIATGSTNDPRRPEFFAELMARCASTGVDQLFRPLGVVPLADLAGLMRNAAAIVNPSLFEGWSTSVEEGKALGKHLILSSIDVHREQAPERCSYFEPFDAERLAELLWSAWQGFDAELERTMGARARTRQLQRQSEFARRFAAIAREAAA